MADRQIKVTELAYVGYPVTDINRAKEFYEGILGLTKTMDFSEEGFAWVEYDIGACTLAIGSGMEEWKPSPEGAAAALEVEDYDLAMEILKEKNVRIVMDTMESEGCRMAVILDPDSNSLVIHKRK